VSGRPGRVVDVHQHLWPEPFLCALEARRDPPRLRGNRLELALEGAFEVDLRAHELDVRLDALDRDGVDLAIVSLPPTLEPTPELLDAYHEGILELVRASGGRLAALATDGVLDGFLGTCVSAEALLDLDALVPVVDELSARGGFLFVHPGPAASPRGAPAWWAAVVGYTAQMQAAYAAWLAGGVGRWPELPVVFAILAGGAPVQLDRLASRGGDVSAASHPSIYLDTASYGRAALAPCDPAQLVYGSDAPVIDAEPTHAAVRALGLERTICVDNPARLLG
jgi:hypothetical protein